MRDSRPVHQIGEFQPQPLELMTDDAPAALPPDPVVPNGVRMIHMGTSHKRMAIVGALAARSPTNALLVALGDAVPRLAEALPPVITACGAIVAAMSDPPRLVRRK